MIELENLSKSYHHYCLFDKLNLKIQPAVVTAIRGRVGTGKSTLLKIIAGLDTEYEGIYRLFDTIQPKQEKLLTPYRLKHIGYIPQGINLLNHLTCFENISLPLRFLHMPPQEREVMVNEIMDELQIGHLKTKYPGEISGGQNQLVSIARALVKKPAIIIGDELTGALDQESEEMVIHALKRRCSKETVIVVATHSQTLANKCQQIIELSQTL